VTVFFRRLLGGAKQLAQRTYYAAAQMTRLTTDWAMATLRSPDMEAKVDLRILRTRSRALIRDDANANAFVKAALNNVVGPTGIKLRPRHTTLEGQPFPKANAAIAAAWKEWSRAEFCTMSGQLTLVDVANLALRTTIIDGECLIRKIVGVPNKFGFALHFIDADQLDEYYNRFPEKGENEIRMGIEIDAYQRPVAYHIWTRHPSELTQRERVRVPADEIIHLKDVWRANGTRGFPWMAPVMLQLQMLRGLVEGELVASRASANKMGFITFDPEKGGAFTVPAGQKAPENLLFQPDQVTPALGGVDTVTMDASPGSIESLGPGQSFVEWDPKHPNGNFAEFQRAILHYVASGLGVAYDTMTGDLREANYSSMRQGAIRERATWRGIQQWFAAHFYQAVYEAWLPSALVAGGLDLPSFSVERWRDVQWQPRGWDWVDPFKDLQADSLAVAMGVTSRGRLCDERGDDFEEILNDLAEEKALAEEYGVTLSLDTRLTQTPDAGGSNPSAADEADAAAAPTSGQNAARILALTRKAAHG
jgi:lambda family phage portal protein